MCEYWESPDGKITKCLISKGSSKYKPTEGSECKLEITETSEDLSQYSTIIIGDGDSDLARQFEICVTTMFVGEISKFVVNLERKITFTLELLEMKLTGFLYEWNARKKFEYAIFQKEKGNVFFSKGEIREAGFRFNKGIKIASLIPIDVTDKVEEIDGVAIKEIKQLKAILYNNLASCFFKKEKWPLVIEFCDKVFIYDKNNVKALYRAGVAYIEEKNYEKADGYLKKVLEHEPNNKSAAEHHKFVQIKLEEAKKKCDLIAKKMIGAIFKT